MLGELLTLSAWTVDGNGVPTVPDRSPLARIYSSAGLVAALRIPVNDKAALTGYFHHRQVLDSRFTTGPHTICYHWLISSVAYSSLDRFEIVAGGDSDGAGLAAFFLKSPAADHVLVQSESGRILRKRNPRV